MRRLTTVMWQFGCRTWNVQMPAADLLTAERQDTLVRIGALTQDLAEIVGASAEANIDDEHDVEGSTLAYERAQIIFLLSSARSDLVHLEQALTRVATGRYGVCEECGTSISPDRLSALPATTCCIDCAARPSRGTAPAGFERRNAAGRQPDRAPRSA